MQKIINWLTTLINDALWQGLLLNLLGFIGGYFISWYRRNSFHLVAILRFLKSLIIRRKYILIWNDNHLSTSEKIAKHLKKKGITERIVCLNAPYELLKFPLRPSAIKMIILIVSDVTKLAASEQLSNQIEQKLVDYVCDGGTLFGTHDIIYRRCRNLMLQQAYSCEINNFQRFEAPIKALRVQGALAHPLLRGLPEQITFDDGEVCWGNWGHEAKPLLVTAESVNNSGQVPLLVAKHFGHNGMLIWLNAGDKGKELCKSLTRPQSAVIQLLYNAATLQSEILEYVFPEESDGSQAV